jgi:NDP-sugar pyrophosphorylase family protein
MSKTAIILAGGKGTRLKPYTIAIPKPLVPVGDKPILEIILQQLKENGFDNIIITVNHLAELIQAYFGDGAKWGVNISYSLEEKPLSTMGPLKLVKNLPENFLVMNGDVLTDLNLLEFYSFHLQNQEIFTIAAHRREEKIDYGVLEADEDNKLVGFKEKPNYSFFVSMGIYSVNRTVLDLIPENEFYGFDHLMYMLLKTKRNPRIFEYSGNWLDIGRPSDYERALEMINNFKVI